jgi:hypothetical protein
MCIQYMCNVVDVASCLRERAYSNRLDTKYMANVLQSILQGLFPGFGYGGARPINLAY